MLNKLKLVIIIILISSINISAKEFYIFPGIGIYNQLNSVDKYPTINGYVYYNPSQQLQKKIINSNRLLLQRSSENMLIANTLTQDKIDSINYAYRKTNEMIDTLNVPAAIAEALVAGGTIDIKVLITKLWDDNLKKLIMKQDWYQKLGSSSKLFLTLLDSTLKGSIDIAIEIYGKDTALLSKYIPIIIKEAYSKSMLVYTHTLNIMKLTNAMVGIINISATQKKQASHSLLHYFLLDYVLKYESDINAMKIDVIDNEFTPTKDVNNFWSIWYHYHDKYNKDLISKFSLAELYDIAILSADYIEDYSVNGLVEASLYQYIDVDDYSKLYINKVRNINKLYYIPRNINKTDGYTLKNGFFGGVEYSNLSNANFVVYFNSGSTVNNLINNPLPVLNSNKTEAFVRYVSGASFELKVINSSGLELENRTIPISPFYIPSFFDDIPSNYQFMPSIAKLFNKNIISGYDDTTFKPKNTTTIGQFLLMASKALLYSKYKDIIDQTTDIDEIVFSKYAEFLKNIGVDIDYPAISNYSAGSMDQPATRAYIAKVLVNIINMNNQINDCGVNDLYGWNDCSNLLKKTVGISGSMVLDVDNQPVTDSNGKIIMEYKPSSFITRDEISAMLVITQNYMQKAN